MEELFDDLILLILAALRPRDCARVLLVSRRLSRLAFQSHLALDLGEAIDAQFFHSMKSALEDKIEKFIEVHTRYPGESEAEELVVEAIPLLRLVNPFRIRRARLEGFAASVFNAIVKRFPNLETISLREVTWVFDGAQASQWPSLYYAKLRDLELGDCTFPSLRSIPFASFSNLRRLVVSYDRIRDDEVLNQISDLADSLAVMSLLEELEFPVYVPSAALNGLTRLRKLKYFFGASFSDDIDNLKPMQSLTDLEISSLQTEDLYSLRSFPKLRRLTILEFLGAPSIWSSDLFHPLASIEDLTIQNCPSFARQLLIRLPSNKLVSVRNLEPQGALDFVRVLPRFQSLKHLYINVLDEGTFTAMVMASLPQLALLETIGLIRPVPQPAFDAFYLLLLKMISRNGHLSAVMANFACLEDEDFVDLISALNTSAKTLRHLCLISGLNALTSKSLRHLPKLTSLTRLSLSFLSMADIAMEGSEDEFENLMLLPTAVTLAALVKTLLDIPSLRYCLLFLPSHLRRIHSHRGYESAAAFISMECPTIDDVFVDFEPPINDNFDFRFDLSTH